jgi:hypothetical protein
VRYPIESASSIPGSGQAFYIHLLENVHVPAKLGHELWLRGCQVLVDKADHPFCGFFPVGKTLKIMYGGSEMTEYTFTGEEQNPVFVKDLSSEAMVELGISSKAKPDDKVFNPFFRPYEQLSIARRQANELPTLALAKAICAFLSVKDPIFTEKDVAEMLGAAMRSANSEEMRYLLHTNHVTWCAARFIASGTMETDIKKNFYGVQTLDFYLKDIGTIMSPILYSFAMLGIDPVEMIKLLDYDLWNIDKAAADMQKCMRNKLTAKKVA